MNMIRRVQYVLLERKSCIQTRIVDDPSILFLLSLIKNKAAHHQTFERGLEAF